jgi:hypothetical protein
MHARSPLAMLREIKLGFHAGLGGGGILQEYSYEHQFVSLILGTCGSRVQLLDGCGGCLRLSRGHVRLAGSPDNSSVLTAGEAVTAVTTPTAGEVVTAVTAPTERTESLNPSLWHL